MGPRGSRLRREALAEAPPATPTPTQGRLDLGPLSDSVGYGLQRAQLAIRSAVVGALAEVDLTPGRFAVLNVIDRNPGTSQADACAALGIQPTNITPLLRDLERRGLIARQTSPTSRRTKMLELTPAGRSRLEKAHRLHQALERRISRALGPEPEQREILLELLSRLATLE